MITTRLCPQCQHPLAADAPDGLCPQCLMLAASGPPPSAAGVGLPADIIDIGDPAEVAKKLPQFEILELLGRGGMGVVYKARQLQLDRLVALKILPPVDALSADFVARFTREARALAKLNHPNIVHVHDFGETGGLYYIIMEYVDGANLRQLFEARKLTPAEALAIVPKICDALQYAHEEGLVHRDIKPENLLIDKKGRVKIADFGLAKLLRREPLDMTLTLSGMALGTLRYMAPEQMDKPETVDHRADLYSLGVVIYEMLTGETPVGRFELPSQKAQVDVRFDEIVLHALEREPDRRYQHASEVRDDVEKVTSKPAVAAAPPSQAAILSESRLSRCALWGAILASLAACLLVAFLLGRLSSLLLVIGVAAPFGATILGAVAIAQIKRSGGKLYGLPLAAFDCLLLPLLALGAAACGVTHLAQIAVWTKVHTGYIYNAGKLVNTLAPPEAAYPGTTFFILDAILALTVCFFAARFAWRKISEPENARTERLAVGTGDVGSKLQLAGIGLLIAGILDAFAGLIWIGSSVSAVADAMQHSAPIAWPIVKLLLSLSSIAVVYYTIGSALFLMHRKDDGDITFPLIMAALAPPGCIFGLPAAIYALVLLSKPEVKALFPTGSSEPPATTPLPAAAPVKSSPRHLLSAALVLLCIFGFFFGLSFQAKHSGNAAGLTKIITVGALDPLFVSESGPSGFQTGFNFFSWSFFAVVVGGIAFGALWRIGREDQGKVPRDSAWWRDWWKQVGIWGGLLLIACTVRTVMHPEKVLRPPGDRTVDSRFMKLFSSGPEFREDPSLIPATRTPGRTDYAYAFTVPANHRVFVWLEWWKDGKRTIDQNFNTGYVAKPGQRYDAGVQLVFTDGNIAGPTTAGQKRIDWIFYDPAGHADSGEWRPDFFAGMMTTVSWGEKSSWSPKAGETVTLLEIAGGKNSVVSGPLTDEHLRAGRWQAAMLLKARVEAVPESRPWTSPMTKMNAWNDNQEPTPALLRLGEQFGATLDPFTDARNLREQIAYRIKKDAAARAKAGQFLLAACRT